MEALQFRYEVLRYLLSRTVARRVPRLWSVRVAPLYRAALNPPVPQRPGWMRVRVRASGICGSDLRLVTGRDSLFLAPEASYPFVPGHEIVGVVEADGPPAAGAAVSAGDRVAVWPVIGCRARGHAEPCASCRAGWEGQCERRQGWPGAGFAIGFNRETGGGWSETFVAHVSQLWRLPRGVSDEDALLLDPAAASLAALLRPHAPPPGRTLIVGGGTIGLLTALLHATIGLPGECELLVRHRFQLEWAERHGLRASRVPDERAFRTWASRREIAGRRVRGYGVVHRGVFDRVIDAVGSDASFHWALRAVRPGGTVVLVAGPARVRRLDPTAMWYREVTVRGINQYGPVPWEGEQVHPYDVLLPRLANGSLRFRDLITHEFALAEYVRAFDLAVRRRRDGAIKVVFRPGVPRA